MPVEDPKLTRARDMISRAVEERLLRKAVLSKSRLPDVIKASALPFEDKNGEMRLRLETYMTDGKALHENLTPAEAVERLTELISPESPGRGGSFGQLDLVTAAGQCSIMCSKKGSVAISGRLGEKRAETGGHDRQKRYILSGEEPFLRLLGISDGDGRVIERRRAKFRQINRFLELLRDVMPKLPEKELTVCDYCCGKSYLSFAVYHYLTVILGRKVRMYGVDLKADMTALCSETAEKLGWEGMTFECADIAGWSPPPGETPHLVISLHACDTATDIVLSKAVSCGARVILSTPCCHHELNGMLEKIAGEGEYGYITRHSILRQKLCDAATDALRAARLEYEGYSVEALELIDPDETPKNVMLRCVKTKRPPDAVRESVREDYIRACRGLGVKEPLTLDRLLGALYLPAGQ